MEIILLKWKSEQKVENIKNKYYYKYKKYVRSIFCVKYIYLQT